MDSAAIDSGGEESQQKEFPKQPEYSPLSEDSVSEVEGDYLDPNFASIANTPKVMMKSQSAAAQHNGNSNFQQHIDNVPKNPYPASTELFPLRALQEDNLSSLSLEDDACSNLPQQVENNKKVFQKNTIKLKILVILLVIFISISLGFIILSVEYKRKLKASQSEIIAAHSRQKPLREERENLQVDLESFELKNQTWQEEVDQLKAEMALLQTSEADMKKKLNNTLQKQEDLFQQLQTSEEAAKRKLNEATEKYEELIQKLKNSEHRLSVESEQKLRLHQDKTRRAMGIASKLLMNSSKADTEAWSNILKVVKEELEDQIIENSSHDDKNTGFYQYENAEDVLVFYSIENISRNNSSRKRYAQLSLQNGKLHMHVLQELTPPSHAMILPHEQIGNVVNSGSVTTFIDLSWPGHNPSRVYIKLYGSTARAQQFIWLCTGEQGPSYINSKFDAVLNKGSPVEYIFGGNYKGMSSPSLIPNLTEGGEYLKPSIEGLVTGVVIDDSTNNANFGIYVEEESNMKNAVGFGQVVGEKSMATIKLAAKYEDITEVEVIDCGVVIQL